MSTVAGSFEETKLQNLRLKAAEYMADGRVNLQYIPRIDAIDSLMRVNTAKFINWKKAKDGSDKKHLIELEWVNACEVAVGDNVACDPCSVKLSTNIQEYEQTREKCTGFKVSHLDMIDNDFEVSDLEVKGYLAAHKVLAEAFVEHYIDFLNANQGVNTMGTKGKGVVTGVDTFIKPQYWDAGLFSYIARVAKMNQFGGAVFLSGSLLYEAYMQAKFNEANADGKGAAAMFNALPMYFDEYNVDTVNDPTLKAYLINTGSITHASVVYHTPTPKISGKYRYFSENNRYIPGIKHDVIITEECEGDMILRDYKFINRSQMFLNPTGCNGTNTGILSFVCG